MKNVFKSLIVLVLIVLSFSSCKDDESENIKGTVNVKLTDAPFPFNFATEANVTVDKIELKNEQGEFVTIFEGSASYNMVELTNGTTANVESKELEPGIYAQVRITTSDASVHFSNGNNVEADAFAQVTTVNVEPALVVEIGETSEVLLDLDLNGSFSFSGAIGTIIGWIPNANFVSSCSFHPHFRACDLNKTGKIEGTVKVEGSTYENAELHIEVNGETISTHSEAEGTFKFIGVADGTYTVYASTENSGSTQVANITVSGANTAICEVNIN